MEELVTNTKSQQGIEEAIFDKMEESEVKGKCLKNKLITKEICKSLVDKFDIHDKNWMHTHRNETKTVTK
jgi:hypothetical protein